MIKLDRSFFTTAEGRALAQDPEFRSIFLATVDNIDWPAYGGQDSDLQKADLIEYLDTFAGMNSNAVMFQVEMSVIYPTTIYPMRT